LVLKRKAISGLVYANIKSVSLMFYPF